MRFVFFLKKREKKTNGHIKQSTEHCSQPDASNVTDRQELIEGCLERAAVYAIDSGVYVTSYYYIRVLVLHLAVLSRYLAISLHSSSERVRMLKYKQVLLAVMPERRHTS